CVTSEFLRNTTALTELAAQPSATSTTRTACCCFRPAHAHSRTEQASTTPIGRILINSPRESSYLTLQIRAAGIILMSIVRGTHCGMPCSSTMKRTRLRPGPAMPLHPSRRSFLGAAAGTALSLNLPRAAAASPRFTIGDKDFLLDGKPLQIRCGEM